MNAGTLVAGRFEIERVAGSGGMGVVYKAKDRVEGEHVGLKILTGRTRESAERFAREARTLAELSHPGIVRYVAHGRGPGGDPFLAMEWLEGESLAERLGRGPFEVGEAVGLVERIAGALSIAHRRGIVHRDLKPSNLFLVGGDSSRVKILDFGVARVGAGERAITATGALVGTPGYMSPEQAKGARDVDARADVFALGCVLFRCVAGRPPFEGDDVLAVLLKLVLDSAPSLRTLCPEASPELDALVARMLARDPDERPADAADVAARLAEVARASAAGAPKEKPELSLGAGEHRFVTLVVSRLGEELVSIEGLLEEPEEATGAAGAPGATGAAGATGATGATGEEPTMTLGRPPEGPAELTMAPTIAKPLRVLSPGEARRLALRRLVEQLRGRLDVLADASVLVTFSEGAATDQAASAARCALALGRLAREDAGKAVAIVSGRITSVGGRTMGTLIERGVAQLSGATGSHGILIDETTAGLLGPAFELEPATPAAPTAPTEPGLALLALVAERETAEVARTRIGHRAPFVGRDRELALLGSHYRESALEPVARPVIVSGPPGIGKSRLRYELVRKIEEGELGPPPARVWIGRGESMTAGSPGAMLAAPLLRDAGALPLEPSEILREKLEARAGLRLSGEAAERVTRLFARLAGLPDEPGVTSPGAEGLGRALAEFVAAECEAGPFVLVLEDLHFADAPTVELLDVALRELEGRPFFVLALARPEVAARFPDVFASRGVQEIRLRELSRRNAERLARETLGPGADDARVADIVERAAGNPFYLEELLRASAEGRRDLPDTILGMVEARLEELAPEARRLLRAGSVFGQVFSRRGAGRLLGGEAALDWLAALEDAEFVVRRSESRRPGDAEYAFRHALVQHAAYATLTAEDRALGHRLAAAFLEETGERDAGLLAEHLDRGGSPGRAAALYLGAARSSLSTGDLRTAELRATRGLEALASLPPGSASKGAALGPSLEQVLAEIQSARGDLTSAAAHAARAASLVRPASDAFHAALGELSRISEGLGLPGRLDEVAAALSTCCAREISPGHALAAARAASASAASGRPELFRPFLEAALEAAGGSERGGALEAALFRARSAEALFAGDPIRAAGLLEASLHAAEGTGEGRLVAEARLALGVAELRIGADERGEGTLGRALEEAEGQGLAAVALGARSLLAIALARRGESGRARELVRESLRAAVVLGDRIAEGSARTRLAIVEGTAGDLEAAVLEARAAAGLLEGAPWRRAHALAVAASAALSLGDAASALAPALEARSALDALGALEEGEALVRVVHAEALAASGRTDVARRALALCRTWLLGQASRIAAPALREAFLARVPEHARIVHLARSWLGQDP